MLKRTLTGIGILICVVSVMLLRYVSTIFFDLFVLVISITAAFEMIKALQGGTKVKVAFNYLAISYPSILFGIYLFSKTIHELLLFQIIALAFVFVVCIAVELVELAKNKKNGLEVTPNQLLTKTGNTFFVIIYPITLLGFLYGINFFGLNIGLIGIIIIFAVTMFTDVFAYFFGTLLKGKGAKLCPQISPNKGVIGMIFGALGGVVASALSFLLFYHFGLLGNVFESIELYKIILSFIAFGLVGTFLTQFGDLLSSAIKRKHNIKDFGNIFPGHGGVMDRVDGLMFTSVLIFTIFALIF